jgi:hypothetical protein
MISKDDFIQRVLSGTTPNAPGTAAAGALPGGFDGFDDDDVEDQPPSTDGGSFARHLLEASGFGPAEVLPRAEVILGTDPAARSLPERVHYWPKAKDRPFQTLLFEVQGTGRTLLEDDLFRLERKQLQVEDALHRLLQHALVGFERGGEARTAEVRRGKQTETLVVVSVADDRTVGGRQLVCFGTKCVTTEALEVFTLREEARDWDLELAKEHLGQLYQRHFSRLGGVAWQDAFITGAERKLAEKVAAECSALIFDAKSLVRVVRSLLDEIAGSFGIRRKSDKADQRLVLHDLPDDHDIGVDPEDARKKDFQNPLHGMRVFDADERLMGYIVHVHDPTKTSAATIRARLEAHNRFHNVLVLYPSQDGGTFELWQGKQPLSGRLNAVGARSRFDAVGGLVQLISRFFVVSKSPLATPKQLATELAWRARHLRRVALEELMRGRSGKHHELIDMHARFNKALAEMSCEEFADAYAQTITYGLLAARWLSNDATKPFTRQNVADLLPSTSPFLKALFNEMVSKRFDANLSWLLDDVTGLLRRTAVKDVFRDEVDPSIHFYQDFLDEYDPKIRKDRGVYYTPDEVVTYIVRTVDTSLREQLGLPLGLADTSTWGAYAKARGIEVPKGVDPKAPFVQILDPATGTGTFPLRVIEVIHETMMEKWADLDDTKRLEKWRAYVRHDLLPRLNGFELMVAPYIVSHLRLGLALERTGFRFMKGDRVRVFLTNTLELHAARAGELLVDEAAEEGKLADQVKVEAPISVVLGNPPYEREPAETAGVHKGGWVRSGWKGWNHGRPPLEDYAEPTRNAGRGGDLKNIYNLYVYFWRWAGWRVFDRYGAPGVVSFITAASYLRGPGFSGMREELRRSGSTVDVLDLEGDQRGTRVTENVFCITIPVCVGSVVADALNRDRPGVARYHRVTGSRADKLAACASWARDYRAVPWTVAPVGFQESLVASEGATFASWPSMLNLFPWQQSGCKAGRTWVLGETRDVLTARWNTLFAAPSSRRAELFKDSPTGQKAHHAPVRLPPAEGRDLAVLAMPTKPPPPSIERLGFRSFDRQWIVADSRFLDRAGPPNWHVRGMKQTYFTSLLSGVLGPGPGATVTAYVPDLHHFRGSYGGKDVVPLWRDPEGTQPNQTAGFSAALSTALGSRPSPEDIFAYAYAVLANPGYVARFTDELQVPGPRLPVTKDKALFERGAAFGRDLLRWHTYGERFRSQGDGFVLAGKAQVTRSIPESSDAYPERHRYDGATQVLMVGDGQVGPVAPEVMAFSVSGLQVVKSWLDYRMKKGAGKKSSPLDDIRPERWTADLTRELLELLWVLEWTLAQYPTLDAWLEEVLASELFTADEIPQPTEAERKEPKVERNRGGTLL